MTTDPRIEQLVERFAQLREQGRAASVAEVCHDCPELQDELLRALRAQGALDAPRETLPESSSAGGIPSVDDTLPPGKAPPPATGLHGAPDLPGYKIVSELGRGGMGVVYLARQVGLNRLVAIKMILTGASAGPRERARFHAEAEAVARLHHPNIVQIFEIGERDGCPYFSLEYVEGESLYKRQDGSASSPYEAARLLAVLARAIHYAHQRGVVHRDLKPANILLAGPPAAPLGDCLPKITDFGLAKHVEEDVRLTQTGMVLGTPCYMSPEQVEDPSGGINPAVDIYGLGAVFYELLTGRPPFLGHSNFETMRQVVSEKPARPSAVMPGVPRKLEDICLRCLEKSPQARYATAAELADDLEEFLASAAEAEGAPGQSAARLRTSIRPAPRAVARPARWPISRRGALASLGGIVVVAALAAWGFEHYRQAAADDPLAAAAIAADTAPIRVGVLHSLTGTMAISEASVVDATLLAIDEINQHGGLLGRRVEAIIADGRSDPDTFLREAERLINEEHVCTVFGCWTSASRRTVRPLFETNNHLLVYPIESEGLEESPNIVYMGAAPNQQIIPAVKWCFAFLDKRRFFLVGSDYVFPHAANEIVKDELKTMGGTVVGEAYLPLGSSAVAPIIAQIQAARPDMILNTINGDSNVAFFRELRAAGIKPQDIPVMSFSIGEQELRSISVADLAGDYSAKGYFQSVDRPENRRFLELVRAKYGPQRVVSDGMEAAYVGVHLWAQAVTAAGTDDVHAVREAIRGQRFAAPSGPVMIDPELLNSHRMARIGQVHPDGQFLVVWSSGSPLAPVPYPKSRPREEWDALLDKLYHGWGGRWSNDK